MRFLSSTAGRCMKSVCRCSSLVQVEALREGLAVVTVLSVEWIRTTVWQIWAFLRTISLSPSTGMTRSRCTPHMSREMALWAKSSLPPEQWCHHRLLLQLPHRHTAFLAFTTAQRPRHVHALHQLPMSVRLSHPCPSHGLAPRLVQGRHQHQHQWIQKVSVRAQQLALSMALRPTGQAVLPTLAATLALSVTSQEHIAVVRGFHAGLGFTGVVVTHPPPWWSRE